MSTGILVRDLSSPSSGHTDCYSVVLGVPFNDTNWRLEIAEIGEAILGDKLLGFQASNEPDLYQRYLGLHYQLSAKLHRETGTVIARTAGGRRTSSTSSEV